MSEPSTHAIDWDWKKLTRKTAEQQHFEDSSGMAIDTMTETIETDLIESCCDGGRVTGPCTKPMIAKSTPVEEPPPKPDNHGPKKPIRKPRVVSVDAFFPEALHAVELCLAVNDPEKGDSWRERTVEDHLAHASDHIRKWHAGDTTEQHLVHNATRALQALQVALKEGKRT